MKKILVIAPHPDDEILGCGGVLKKFKNKKIYWLIITNMIRSKGFSNKEILRREREIKSISKKLAFKKVVRLDFIASELSKSNLNKLIQKLSLEIKKIKPDTIFSPFLHDAHSDHFFTTYALNHILKTFRYPFVRECYQYETLSETNQSYVKRKIFTPNVYFNITNQLKDKLKLAKIYKSEFKKHPFPRRLDSIKALAVLRGSESGYKYAESFQLILKKND